MKEERGGSMDLLIVAKEKDKDFYQEMNVAGFIFPLEGFAMDYKNKFTLDEIEELRCKDKKCFAVINRMFFENKMLEAIENELYYENLYRQKGIIVESDIDIKKIKSIIKYDVPYNIVNYLLQYPLANILSSCLINNYIIQNDNQLVEKCINMDLYKILEDYSLGRKTL